MAAGTTASSARVILAAPGLGIEAHGVGSFRRRSTATVAAVTTTSNASTPAPASATLRGLVSLGAGAGGTATGFTDVPGPPPVCRRQLPGQGRDRVQGAGADDVGRLPGTVLRGCGDAAHHLGSGQGGVLGANQCGDPGDVAGRVAGAAERDQLLVVVGQAVGQAAAVALLTDAMFSPGAAIPTHGPAMVNFEGLPSGATEAADST